MRATDSEGETSWPFSITAQPGVQAQRRWRASCARPGMLLQFWRNRGDFGRLRDMSDWELADIGLDRDDLRTAWARRAEVDPTHYLGMTARARGALEDAARRVS